MAESLNYYEILQISPQATLKEIKIAFRRLARQYHPDLNPNNPAAEIKFKHINQAYQVLSDSYQRNLYDRQFNESYSNLSQSSASKLTEQDYYYRGLSQAQRQSYLDAIESFSRSLELNPNFLEAYSQRIEVYLKIEKYREALEDCHQVLQVQSNCAQAYYYLGCSRQHLGYTQSAIEAYTKAIFYQPDEAKFYYQRGFAYQELQEFSLACNDFNQAVYLFQKVRDYRLSNLAKQQLKRSYNKSKILKYKFFLKPLFFCFSLWINLGQIFNPQKGLVYVYLSRGKKQALAIGLIFGLISYFLFLQINLITPRILNILPFISLIGISFISRYLCRRYGHLAGDVFLAGSSLLPIAILGKVLTFLEAFPASIKNSFCLLILSYMLWLLYRGCTQISNLPRWLSIFIAPLMLFLAIYPIWRIILII